jgi:hypothetical protein
LMFPFNTNTDLNGTGTTPPTSYVGPGPINRNLIYYSATATSGTTSYNISPPFTDANYVILQLPTGVNATIVRTTKTATSFTLGSSATTSTIDIYIVRQT